MRTHSMERINEIKSFIRTIEHLHMKNDSITDLKLLVLR